MLHNFLSMYIVIFHTKEYGGEEKEREPEEENL